MTIEFHEYANLFPLIEGQEFSDLVEDIRAHGVREPVVIYNGRILDGRNRYRASERAGVLPDFVFYGDEIECRVENLNSLDDERIRPRGAVIDEVGEVIACGDYLGTLTDPLAMVVSLNLKRRHLNESQRAMVAARLVTMRHGGDRKSDQAENLPLVTQRQAAELLNTSDRNVRTAATVQRSAAPELVKAVESGKVAVSAAANATKFMTQDEQREAVENGNLAKAVAMHKRAEEKLKEAEKVIAEAPKFTPEEETRIKQMMGAPGDGDIYSRIDEITVLISEQPEPKEAASRIPESLSHAIDLAKIHSAAQWLMDFCTAWSATRSLPSFVPKFLLKEVA